MTATKRIPGGYTLTDARMLLGGTNRPADDAAADRGRA